MFDTMPETVKLPYPQLIRHWAEKTADRVVIDQVGGDAITYEQLHQANLRWAGAFRNAGIEAGDRVMSFVPSSVEAIELWGGLGWLRALEVPVNTAYRGHMLEHLVANSAPKAVVVAPQYLDRFAEYGDLLRDTTVVVLGKEDPGDIGFGARHLTSEELLAESVSIADLPEPAPWDLTGISYTSGTTGPAKGVLVTWVRGSAGCVVYLPPGGATADDAHYCPFPTYHVGSSRGTLLAMALVGGRWVLRESFSTESYWDDIRSYNCTLTMMLGAITNFLYRQPPREDDADNPLRGVFMVPVIPEVDEFKERFGVQVWTGFGGTEINAPFVTGWLSGSDAYKSCGRLRPGFDVRVVDENDQALPPGETGELIIRADEPFMINQGYYKMPEATAEAWRNGWFHTGDGFTYDEEGNYYFVDRVKDALRRRGVNISSMEVEGGINQHPAVLESAVIAVPSEWGEDEVKAVVVCKPGMSVSPEELIEFLIPRMPHFTIPRYLEFVDALPKTPTEKVRKVELREQGVNENTWDREAAGIVVKRS